MPKEIDEAAQIDGAGRLTVLFRIQLPLVWPGIVTAIVFTFVACWNEFAASLVILSTAGNQPLSVALTKFVGQYETSWHYVFGVSIVAIIPVVVLFMLIEKRLVGGLTAGSVKSGGCRGGAPARSPGPPPRAARSAAARRPRGTAARARPLRHPPPVTRASAAHVRLTRSAACASGIQAIGPDSGCSHRFPPDSRPIA